MAKRVLTQKKREMFLRVLSQTGIVAEAARACGFCSTSFLQKFRREDEYFAEEWDAAMETAVCTLEKEAIDRAINGVLEPKYYRGKIVEYIPIYLGRT